MVREKPPISGDLQFFASQDSFVQSGIVGKYTPPKELKIAGIDSLVVDPHNEALPQWDKVKKKHSILLHIDAHGDMGDEVATVETVGEWGVAKEDYQISLGIGNFIVVAVHYGIVGVIYHFDPRQEIVYAYGKINNGEIVYTPATKVVNGMIRWASPNLVEAEILTIPQFLEQISKAQNPLIVDKDLDALLCTKSGTGFVSDLVAPDPDILYKQRLEKIVRLLTYIPLPEVITISRSQTPEAYCPPDKVDMLKRECVRSFSRVFQRV